MADAMFMATQDERCVQAHCCRSAKRIYGAFHPAALDRTFARLLDDGFCPVYTRNMCVLLIALQLLRIFDVH